MREVPRNNSLKREIKRLLELCNKDEKDKGERRDYFREPVTEDEMEDWEERNGCKIPESYKEWLRFSGECRIAGNAATFWGPSEFHSDHVPEDLVAIGEILGDGEVVCFSKNTGVFVRVSEGETAETDDFGGVLRAIIKLLDDKPILSEERYLEIMQKIREKRAMENR
ncbi:MAG: SMI1/KNR4 family protein [Clostridium sp.]|nr:SMI1/KNR4 family protein [Acetatifactor muris]MCM1527600.1 SMI1/KNR4 family protein [Bacteroides sp.]MCM1563841.1 SMI1/KNR4 family protein [Clostridium sp.]